MHIESLLTMYCDESSFHDVDFVIGTTNFREDCEVVYQLQYQDSTLRSK